MNSRSALPRTRNETAFEARLAPDTRGDVSFGGRVAVKIR